ncbi:MAG: phage holin family protein [Clostridiales bacterium]
MDTIKSIKIVVTAIGTAIAAQLGILALPVFMLLGLNITDYATAILAAKSRGEEVSSSKGMKGIIKKLGMYVLVCLGGVVDILLAHGGDSIGLVLSGSWLFASLVAVWLICNELISILENLIDLGTPIPPFLMPLARKIKDTIEAKGGSING